MFWNSFSKISSSEIADVYQSLIGTWFAAVVLNRSRTFARVPHDDCDIVVIHMESTGSEEHRRYSHEIHTKWGTGSLVISMLIHWYCLIGFCCDCMIKCFQKFQHSQWRHTMCLHRTGPSHSVNDTHDVVSHSGSTYVLGPLRAPLLGHKITGAS